MPTLVRKNYEYGTTPTMVWLDWGNVPSLAWKDRKQLKKQLDVRVSILKGFLKMNSGFAKIILTFYYYITIVIL
jgi:hypothetical protein